MFLCLLHVFIAVDYHAMLKGQVVMDVLQLQQDELGELMDVDAHDQRHVLLDGR